MIVHTTKRPVDLLKALADASQLMMGDGNEREVIQHVLTILGQTAGVDRSYIFRNIFDDNQLSLLHYEYEWNAEGIIPQIDNEELHHVPWEYFADLKDILASGSSFAANTASIENQIMRESLEVQNIKSVLFMPLFSSKKFWGFVGFDDCQTERNWDEVDLVTLKAIASNLGTYLHKIELAHALNEQIQKVEEQKLFYENVLDSMPADIVVFDTQHKYLYVNKHAIKDDENRKWIVGKDDYEYCKKRNKDISIADERRAIFEKTIASKEPYTFEEKYDLPNGQVKYHLRIMKPVLKEDGDVTFLMGYGLDITDLKVKYETILKQHKAIEAAPVGIALLDKEGKYYYMNKVHAEIFEYSEEELLGKTWHILYNQDEIDKISAHYFPQLIQDGSWSGETLGKSKNGRLVPQEITLSLFEDGDLLCVTRDLTPTIKELEKVRLTNQQLELAMTANNLGKWTWEVKNGVLNMNPTAQNMLGSKESTVALEDWVNIIHPDYKQNVLVAVERHFSQIQSNPNDIYKSEYQIRHANGNYIWVLAIGKVIKVDEQGNPELMTGFSLDITEQKELDEKIKQSDKRYRDLVENLKEVVFQTDLDGKLTFVNQNWTQSIGYSNQETLGRTIVTFISENDKSKFLAIYKKLSLNSNATVQDVIRLVNKDGNDVWFDFNVSVIKNDEGSSTGIIGTAVNISERKKIESELQQNKQILDKVMSSIDDIIWSFDIPIDSLTYISPSCMSMTGVSDLDFYQSPSLWYDIIHQEDVAKVKESDDDLHFGRIQARDVVYRIITSTGEEKWVRDQAKLIVDEAGNPTRIDGVTIDISKLIEAEKKLKLSEEKYRLISENIEDIITILDLEGNISYISPSAQRFTDINLQNLLNKNIFEVVFEDDKESLKQFLQNLNLDDVNKISFRIPRANGDLIWIESIVKPITQTEDGKPLVQASSRDITINKLAEIELTNALQKEKELGELKSRFVSMASHEFRTPLSTIRVGAELIKLFLEKNNDKIPAQTFNKVNEKLDDIIIDVDRISELMSDIFTMGKLEVSKIPFKPESTNLPDFILDYINQDGVRVLYNRKINLQLADLKSPVSIDKKLMKHVLQNVLSNAVKYSPKDSPVNIRLNDLGNHLLLEIQDFGMGIPEKDLPFVFESFFRSTNVENIPGTGLGMVIIKMFVEMHGGTVNIESVLHSGTTVRVTIPK